MTAEIKPNHWYVIKNQSLARFANYAGFDLALYDVYSTAARQELRKRAISEAIFSMRNDVEERFGFDLRSVNQGVYVITLSNGLAVQYQTKPSDIIYIGMGAIAGRLKNHFQGKLFDFMLGLSGANFDFRFAMPIKNGEAEYYKHVEHLMLEDFQKTFGGLKAKKYPLMNKNAGSDKKTLQPGVWWRTPMKMTGKKVKWALSPVGGDFGTLD
jgi:hypothetical protein